MMNLIKFFKKNFFIIFIIMNYIFKYKIPKEYINLINDIIKFSTIFFIINFLLFVSMSNKDLFNKNFCDIFFF